MFSVGTIGALFALCLMKSIMTGGSLLHEFLLIYMLVAPYIMAFFVHRN